MSIRADDNAFVHSALGQTALRDAMARAWTAGLRSVSEGWSAVVGRLALSGMTRAVTRALVVPRGASTRRAAVAAELPARITVEAQWARATGRVGATLARAETACRAHDLARQQLEAARYALDELVLELGPVLRLEPAAARPVLAPASAKSATGIAARPIAA